jgi:hypothetical protein
MRLTCSQSKPSILQEVTCFSYDESREFHPDDRSLRYYYTPELDVDLSHGFDGFKKHDDSKDEHLHGLLQALIDLEKRSGKVEADIVTWRGIMTKACFKIDIFNMNNGSLSPQLHEIAIIELC